MLASKNESIAEAANTMFELSAEEQIRKRCRDREEYYQDMRNYERVIAEMQNELSELEKIAAGAKEHGYESAGD